MKRINIFSLLLAFLFVASCDYNDEHFPGYDTDGITDLAVYEGVFPADGYPEDGYFRDRGSLEAAVNTMLKGILKYCDKGSTAQVSALYGDVTPGFSNPDAKYTLTAEDYDAMGTENGQPGRFDNFDANMDVDSYLISFCAAKYASLPDGAIVSITYQFYATGAGASARTSSYKKVSGLWLPHVFAPFTADIDYTLTTADYDAMGTESGQPGRYDNFDANMDVDMYNATFLKLKYPYTATGKTAKVNYLFYANSLTQTRSSFYQYDGANWQGIDPYAESVEITTKIAELEFNGTDWVIKRLLGGNMNVAVASAEYAALVEWVAANKPAYMQDDQNEFYFGASTRHGNFSQSYDNWKSNDPNNEYGGLSNDDLQTLMDKRVATGIIDVVLPKLISTPDPGLSYNVRYAVYGGRGTGDYTMSFMYNEDDGVYELVAGPIKH